MSENEVQQPVEEEILSPEYITIYDWKSDKIAKLAGAFEVGMWFLFTISLLSNLNKIL